MSKKHLSLQPSEAVVVQAAAQIYAAYIANGQVKEGEQNRWMERSIREAVMIAAATEDLVISDNEMDASDDQDRGRISVGRIRTTRNRHDG